MLHSLLSRFRKPPPPKEKIKLNNQNEALRANPLVQQAEMQMRVSKRDIETAATDPETTRKLITRVISQWEELSEEPYWSNANLEENKLANIDDKIADGFFKEGADWMEVLAAYESRCGVKIKNGLCVELGAGAGKYTHALAERFRKVVAIDVSGGHLDVSSAYLEKQGLRNVTTAVLKSPDDLRTFENVDLFLALAVFPHNAPPIQRIMLDHAFAQISPGGFALFQIQDWYNGYSFSTKRFLDGAPDAMCDCHCFPKTDVFEIMRDHDLELLDFIPDFFAECLGSYTFFGRKQAAKH